MNVLKNKLSVIDDVVPPGSKVVYLDIPLHLNVGDLLIYKGTEQFFKEKKYQVLARRTDQSSMKFLKENKNLPKDVIILLHGGGNFGDLYGHHQRLREQVVLDFPNHKVVYLPQTVHFKDPEEQRKSASIISQHKNLTIFCRDTRSQQILKEQFCDNVFLCPDMAHSLWGVFPTQVKENIKKDTLWMIRKDIEETNLSSLEGKPDISQYEDWKDICTNKDRNAMRILINLEKVNKSVSSGVVPVSKIWGSYTDKLVDRVNEYFMSHDLVVTSRMHGHILCCLLGVKTKLLDNSYGKNSTYFDAWTQYVPDCELIKL
ncbi:polysaccharide pyruvyl transferase family protein [Erwinia sp. S38]|uniref:polysaccharide pyruvyl transferase family protein n=1 Tax=Erwinia sp. S38 TaxID=2769338 RepID=UPI00190DDD30|nr:polysaccharide pyruvyl transferase family protein [Erwinia sp. S38]MBK0002096.1 polysaccharide pyruvyl transferase family protein [Erwinia sp. S38]